MECSRVDLLADQSVDPKAVLRECSWVASKANQKVVQMVDQKAYWWPATRKS